MLSSIGLIEFLCKSRLKQARLIVHNLKFLEAEHGLISFLR